MSEEQIVHEFTKEMLDKIELRRNRYVPLGWKTMDEKRLLFLLKQEIEELEQSPNKENSSSECLDIANYAMFIWALNKGI